MNKLKFVPLLALATAFPAGSVQAHHSFAMFDRSKCAVLTGKVSRFVLTYPHSWLWIEVPDKNGKTVRWAFEGLDPASLRVRGWTPRSIRAGHTVTVAFHPLRDGRSGGAFEQVRLASGDVLETTPTKCELSDK